MSKSIRLASWVAVALTALLAAPATADDADPNATDGATAKPVNPFTQELNKRREGLKACDDFNAKYVSETAIGEAYNQSSSLEWSARLALAQAFDDAIGALRVAEKNVRAHIAGRDERWTRVIDLVSTGNKHLDDARTAIIATDGDRERKSDLWGDLFRVGIRLDGVAHQAIIAACAEVFPRVNPLEHLRSKPATLGEPLEFEPASLRK